MKKLLILCLISLAVGCKNPNSEQTNTSNTSDKSSLSYAEIKQQLLKSRAIESIIWGMPAVNLDFMYQAMLNETKGRDNQMLYWSRPLDWKNQTLTPNVDVIYFTPFFDTKEVGPVVLEVPPADNGILNGTIMDAWQMPLADVGPAGSDKGKGGKYLILPPDYKGKVPEGYIVLPSITFKGYALIRSLLKSTREEDVAKAVEYGKRMKIYPLSQAKAPAPTAYIDAADVLYDATIKYDIRFFESLNRIVQYEPWLDRDRIMIDKLSMIGIEKGKPFTPDADRTKLLNDAAAEAQTYLEGKYIEELRIGASGEGSKWSVPQFVDLIFRESQNSYSNLNLYPVDSRGLLFTFIFFTPKQLGTGQFYLISLEDSDGNFFDGSKTYKLRVPANVPVSQYWSATAYDLRTHALIRNTTHSGRSSLDPNLQMNDDGSVDLYFGPKAPAGKESNWTPTDPNAKFEVLMRFYGPKPELFDKSWSLPNIELVK